MAACPAASSRSRSCVRSLAVASLLVFLVSLGGRLRVFIVEPDLAWLSLALMTATAAAALLGCRVSRCAALPLLFLVMWSLVTSAAGVHPRAGWEATLWLALWCGFFALGHRLTQSPLGAKGAVTVVLPSVAFVCLVGLLQATGHVPIEPAYMTEHGRTRLLSTLNHPNNLASYLALVLPLVLARFGAEWLTGRRRPVALVLAVMTLGLLYLGAGTYSRGGQLGIAAGLGVFVLAASAAIRTRRGNTMLLLGALLAMGVVGLMTPLGHRFQLALGNLGHFGDDQRAGTWRAAAAMVREHPLTGVGAGAFFVAFPGAKSAHNHADLFTHAHSWYLHVAAEGGLPALLALAWLLVGGAVVALRASRRGDDPGDRLMAAGLASGVLGYAVSGLLDVSTGVPAVAATVWLVLGMAWGTGERAPAPSRVARGGLAAVALVLLLLFGIWSVWNRGHAHYQRMLAQWCSGHWAEGALELERARALDPGQRAYSLVRIDLALIAGRHAEAKGMLSAMDRRGELLDAPYRLMLAHLLRQDGDLPGALAVQRLTAERLDRAQPVAWTELGWLAWPADPVVARAAFEQALANHPEQLGAHLGLAQTYWSAKDQGSAARVLERAVANGLARDRLPRLLVAYGRLDPLLVVPVEQRGRFWRARFSWHGAVVPAVTATLYEQWLATQPGR